MADHASRPSDPPNRRSYSIPQALTQTAGGARLRVYVALAERLNPDGQCWPSIATLAHDAGVKERSVAYALVWLEANGWVVRTPRVNQSTIFTLPHLSRSNPVQEPAPLQRIAPLQEPAGVQETAEGGARTCSQGVQELADRTPLIEHIPRTPPKSTKKRRPVETLVPLESLSEDERAVWEHYLKARQHHGMRTVSLTDTRRDVITAALAMEPLDVLRMAIAGMFRNPHNLGQNDRNTKYLDIHHAIGTSKRITAQSDAWMARNEAPRAKPAGAGGRMSEAIQRLRDQRNNEGTTLLLLTGGAS